ncbi:MAG: DUF2934 domain-containing protein [Rhodobacterales bacterium]|nr:DUF2934 domain-containing protein [Rhodobacterales bacterium]MDX5414156.1 DUF2934 domain-containing protein [Rhodobacterales bacterium]
MDQDEFNELERRIEARAVRLWKEAGSPEGGHAPYIDRARQLVAFAEVDPPTLDPAEAARPVVEEAEIQKNLGEFPTLRDQGEERTFQDRDAETGDDQDDR